MVVEISEALLEKLHSIVEPKGELDPRQLEKPHSYFRNKSEASKIMRLSRPTIDKILDEYPVPPQFKDFLRITCPHCGFLFDYKPSDWWLDHLRKDIK